MTTRVWYISLCLLAVVLAFPSQVGATETLINQTVTVDNLSYRYWYQSLDFGDRLSGSIDGSSDINFYILDSSQFADFSAGRSFYSSYRALKVSSLPSFSFTVPSDGTWYIVLDNQYSWFTSKSVAITIYLDPYVDPYSQPAGYAPDLSGFFVFVGIIILVVVILVVYSTAEKRKRMGGAPKPQVPQPPPSL